MESHQSSPQDQTERALCALDNAKSLIRAAQATADAKTLAAVQDAIERTQQANVALLLTLLNDEWTPAALFKPWASVRAIQQWGYDGKLAVQVMHCRSCVRPSDFFRHWNTLRS